MISRHLLACVAGSGSTPPSGQIGAVPATRTRSPTRTARLNPIRGSNGEPDEMFRRSIADLKPDRPGLSAHARDVDREDPTSRGGGHWLPLPPNRCAVVAPSPRSWPPFWPLPCSPAPPLARAPRALA